MPTVGVGVALATFQPNIFYDPPLIKVTDIASHNSTEVMTIRRDGPNFTFHNEISPPMVDPASEPGCEPQGGVIACPRAGVEKIIVLLGNMDDTASIKLGDSAGKVRQVVKGQDDHDDLFGGPGTQKLVGGFGDDEIYGEAGRDKLIGGPGTDICVGSAQDDTFKGCETISAR